MNILTITFSGDLFLVLLQIRSFEKYLSLDGLSSYIIVINEVGESYDLVESIIKDELNGKRFESITRIVPASSYIPDPVGAKGWLTQQELKISVCASLTGRYALVLDSKNHLVADFCCFDLIYDSRIVTSFRVKSGAQQVWWSASCLRVGLDPDIMKNVSSPPTTTPFMLDLDVLSSMFKSTFRDTSKLSTEFREKGTRFTEFFLYSAFVYKSLGSFEKHFVESKEPFSITLFGKYPESDTDISSVIKKMRDRRFIFFGFHRARLSSLNSDSPLYDSVRNLWDSSGLEFRDIYKKFVTY